MCRGLLECDGTSLRHWRKKGTSSLIYLQIVGMLERNTRKLCLWSLGEAEVQNFGKPPPESLRKIRKTDAFNHVETHDSAGVKTWLLTDGARCYPPWSRELGVTHRRVSHATGEFEKKATRNGARLSAHTGTIDSTWQKVNASIPNSISSRSPKIWLYMRACQWRRLQKGKDLCVATAKTLDKLRKSA